MNLLSLIPAGSRRVDGTKATVYITPEGVIRMHAGEVHRPNIPVVLQPTKTYQIDGYTVEHLPYVTPASELPEAIRFEGRQYIMAHLPDGYFDYDLHNGNYGQLQSDSGCLWVVIDPNAVRKAK